MIREKSIVKIKKGLYIFGPAFQRRAVSNELLANLIYSPSYISLEYALSRYGLIPERTYTITSICLNRSKTFKTEVATFAYRSCPVSVYPLGIQQIDLPEEGSYLIATPEKALVDLISQVKGLNCTADMKEYLYENMRMEQSDLRKLNKKLLLEICNCYNMSNILIQAIYD